MNAIQAAILAIDILLEGIDALNAFDRLANGIAAKAEAAGRDVTDDEMNLIKGIQAEAERRRRGA
jgi:hypothetical protein